MIVNDLLFFLAFTNKSMKLMMGDPREHVSVTCIHAQNQNQNQTELNLGIKSRW